MKKITLLTVIMISFLLFDGLPVGANEKGDRKWQDGSIYFIMVDRFMNGNTENDKNVNVNDPNSFQGGDLEGIIEKLDYIKKMGFTTIQLTPIMDNGTNGYHGYSVIDFKAIDEHFGTIEDARKLVKEAHKRDMKVIFDFVVNYTGNQHPWRKDPEKEDWYLKEQYMNEQEDSNSPAISTPSVLNMKNEEVKQYILDAASFWIKETGVDGFGLDTEKPVSKEFWTDFSNRVRSIDEDFILLGKIKNEGSISQYKGTGVNSFVNNPFSKRARNSFKEAGESLNPLFNQWERDKKLYNSFNIGHFLDDPNSQRFTRLALENRQNPITRWKLGLTYMFTSPGIPILYYGSEVPLDGGEVPDNNRLMNFNSGDGQLSKRIEKLNALRDQYPVLTRGDFEKLYSEDGFFIFKRSLEDQVMVVAINNDRSTRTAEIKGLPEGKQLRGILHDGLVLEQKPGMYKLALNREQVDVFLVEPKQGLNWPFISFVLGVFGLFVFGVSYISIKNKKNNQYSV
ncbi:alpha-amylase family glycosyl hydrolase [Halobacillus amylolyticus]|uniref:Alpha-amylase family glycosyl hydrolase n=1 Tax=Halobacillus amylolyticus TaxID=2932259 RepID=A0ABY4HIB0_9BACI|nr:alpha-amylase family glycosyl hydrolase [Halobacillus amylolyticus]UOR14127.1 alpha-amylase family glycosyl hydrolase [Halobacillus amylolyticus]